MARSTKRKHAGISNLEEGSPESQDGNDSGYGTQSPTVAECPFSIEYVQPQSTGAKTKKRKSVDANSDTSPEKLEEDVLSKNMTIGYVIRPGTVWEAMKKYRNFVGKLPSSVSGDLSAITHRRSWR